MKKLLFLTFFVFFFHISLFSDNIPDGSFEKSQLYTNYQFFENPFIYHDLFSDQQGDQSQDKKSWFCPLLLNLVPFGLGSYVQGDIEGAKTILKLDLIGLSAAALGYFIGFYAVENMDWFDNMLLIQFIAQPLAAGGFIIIASNLVYKIIRPIYYSISYNRKLKNRSSSNGKSSFNILAYVIKTGSNKTAPSINFVYSY